MLILCVKESFFFKTLRLGIQIKLVPTDLFALCDVVVAVIIHLVEKNNVGNTDEKICFVFLIHKKHVEKKKKIQKKKSDVLLFV